MEVMYLHDDIELYCWLLVGINNTYWIECKRLGLKLQFNSREQAIGYWQCYHDILKSFFNDIEFYYLPDLQRYNEKDFYVSINSEWKMLPKAKNNILFAVAMQNFRREYNL